MVIVLLPAYNEEIGIASLIARIHEEMTRSGLEYRILLVDDGSTDRTYENAAAMKSLANLEILRHRVNRGLWETIRDGFERAAEIASEEGVIVRLDADESHDPVYIPRLVEKMNEGYDVVICSRFQPGGGAEGLSAYRTFLSSCANSLIKALFPIRGVKEYSCGFRAYRASMVAEALEIFGGDFIGLKGVGFTCTVEKLLRFRMLRARFSEIPFRLHYEKKRSKSKMVSVPTTIGYFVLMIQYLRAWGPKTRGWIAEIERRRAAKPGM